MKFKKKVPIGFTLIELLIVCAIIAILAVIAVPNYSDAVIRSKVSAVKSDMRTMSTAVEAYMADHNRYPIRHHRWQLAAAETSPPLYMVHHAPLIEKIMPCGRSVGLTVMTTPIAYITVLPRDPFNLPVKERTENVYFGFGWGQGGVIGHGGYDQIDYYDLIQTDRWLNVVSDKPFSRGMARGYMLISVGPDQYLGITDSPYGVDLTSTSPLSYPMEKPWTVNTEQYFYDPTNGTISTGNIYRFSGGLTQADLLPQTVGEWVFEPHGRRALEAWPGRSEERVIECLIY